MDKIRWGILGAGGIANTFATGLGALPDAELVAIGSRAQDTAEAFGQKHNIPHRHGSYKALVRDPDVDVIYVATPHPVHKSASILCLTAGKAVLCEKPFTINATEAGQLIAYAREHRLFLMEAMWTRFLPLMGRVRDLLTQDAIGDVRTVMTDFGFRTQFNPGSRLLAPELGGGALLDVGVYTISFASMVMGGVAPVRVAGLAGIGETGVDEQSAYVLEYDAGRLAVLYSAVRTQSQHEAIILGTEGRIRIPAEFYRPTSLVYSRYGAPDEVIEVPFEGNGYNYQAAEVMRNMRAGRIESDILPLAETLAIMQTMDRLREPWGLRYPSEV